MAQDAGITAPLLESKEDRGDSIPTVFDTTLKYYKTKLPKPESKDPESEKIILSAKEWYGFHNYNSLRAGFFGGDTPLGRLFGKDKSHLDIIFSWLLIRNPGYLENIAATKGTPADLLAAPKSPEERKSAVGTATSEAQALSLFQIFLNIQGDMDKELEGILEKLTDKLITELEEVKEQKANTRAPEENKPQRRSKFSLIKTNLSPQAKENAQLLLGHYIQNRVTLEELKEKYSQYFDFDEDGDLRGLHFLDHAKELYTRRKEDSDASLKVLKKSINAYAREQEQATNFKAPRLTKRPDYASKNGLKTNHEKDDKYSVVSIADPKDDHEDDAEGKLTPAQNYEKVKREKRSKKAENQAKARTRGWAYPILRCGAAVFGTCNVVAGVFNIPLLPSNPWEIFGMLFVAASIALATFYSNNNQALTSIKTIKNGIIKSLLDPEDKAKFQPGKKPNRGFQFFKGTLITGITLGVIAVYAVPLFNSLHQLFSQAGAIGTSLLALDILSVIATAVMAKFVLEIFLPKISDFVHKTFNGDGAWRNFWRKEILAPVATGGNWREKLKLIGNHATPNAVRGLAVLGFIGISCYVTFDGLNKAITDSFSVIPGLSGSAVLSNTALAFVALSFVGAFIFTYESLHNAFKYLHIGSSTPGSRWNSSAEDLTVELTQCAHFQVHISPENNPSQPRYPIAVDNRLVYWCNKADGITRVVAAGGSNFGTMGATITGSLTAPEIIVKVGEAGGGTTVSVFNKIGSNAKANLDRDSKDEIPLSTYATYLPLMAQNGIIAPTTSTPNTSSTPSPTPTPTRTPSPSVSQAFLGPPSTSSLSSEGSLVSNSSLGRP